METTDVTEEMKVKREKMLLEQNNDIDTRMLHSLLTKFEFSSLLQSTAFIQRLLHSCYKVRRSGALTAEEIKLAEIFWIKDAQIKIGEEINEFQLRLDQDNVFRCYGKVSFYQPILYTGNIYY